MQAQQGVEPDLDGGSAGASQVSTAGASQVRGAAVGPLGGVQVWKGAQKGSDQFNADCAYAVCHSHTMPSYGGLFKDTGQRPAAEWANLMAS